TRRGLGGSRAAPGSTRAPGARRSHRARRSAASRGRAPPRTAPGARPAPARSARARRAGSASGSPPARRRAGGHRSHATARWREGRSSIRWVVPASLAEFAGLVDVAEELVDAAQGLLRRAGADRLERGLDLLQRLELREELDVG